ncbi:hypothetical protein GOB57_21730 [Sinorhizobium meliloti]|nr:hypothetical protein [Sinorhizobium meliloti]
MKYNFPFAYRIDYLVNGGQKPASRYLISHVAVDIPEITGDEAPVVATWTLTDAGEMRIPASVRYFEGRFVSPTVARVTRLERGFSAGDLPAKGASKRDAAEDIFSLFNHWDTGRYYGPTMQYLLEGKEQTPPEPHRVAAFLGGSHAEMRAEAERNAAGLVIIDGQVHNTVFEPVLHMAIGGGNLQSGVHLKSPHFDRQRRHESFAIGSPKKTLLYRIDQSEELGQEFQRRAAVARGPRPLSLFDEVQVIDPDVFTFSPAENAAARTLGHIVHEYSYEPLHQWERNALREFLDLRDRYFAYIADESSDDVETLLAEAERIVGSQPTMLDQRYVDFLHNMEGVRNNPPEIRPLVFEVRGPRR